MINLTQDQITALDSFTEFYLDPIETVFVLKGYSGTGKSTLVKSILELLPKIFATALLLNPKQKEYFVELTATTNKAAEAFSAATNMTVGTIHSFLGLRVQTDYKTGITTLIPKSNQGIHENILLFIDEASYIDSNLLNFIFKFTRNCKIVFIGDPAQLTPVKSKGTPVFDANFKGAMLSQVVRQAEGNPIVDLSTKFRETVNTGEFFSFKPDGEHIQYMDRQTFNKAIESEFDRPDWKYQDSKVLAWTNKCVIAYNHMVRNHVKGDPHFQVGDYAVCNSFLSIGRQSLKTDQLVCITGIEVDTERYGVPGNYIQMDYAITAFQPKSLEAKNARIKQAKAEGDTSLVAHIDSEWVDLRAAYSCTINKAQGSTYDRVFIDLDDISRCNSGDQIARMLYVGASRARHQVFLTGDLV